MGFKKLPGGGRAGKLIDEAASSYKKERRDHATDLGRTCTSYDCHVEGTPQSGNPDWFDCFCQCTCMGCWATPMFPEQQQGGCSGWCMVTGTCGFDWGVARRHFGPF
jgi:hypothetical protein